MLPENMNLDIVRHVPTVPNNFPVLQLINQYVLLKLAHMPIDQDLCVHIVIKSILIKVRWIDTSKICANKAFLEFILILHILRSCSNPIVELSLEYKNSVDAINIKEEPYNQSDLTAEQSSSIPDEDKEKKQETNLWIMNIHTGEKPY